MASFTCILRTRVSVWLVAIGLVVAPGATARSAERLAPRYSIAELSGIPMNLNNHGEIAGWVYVGGNAHAAIYRNGGWVDYGVLQGDQLSALFSINDAGAAAGFSFASLQPPIPPDTYADNRWRAAWVPEGATAIEPLSPLTPDSFAYAINESGVIVGCLNRYDDVFPDAHHAFVLANGVVTDVHAQLVGAGGLGFDFTCARDVNDAGVVVGEVQLQNMPSRGFVYQNGAVTTLGPATYPSTQPYLTNARAINSQGKIVGEGRLAGFVADHALVYDLATDSFTSAGVEASGAYNSKPNDINAGGDIVGMMFLPSGERAFLAASGLVVDLTDQITDGTDWVLQEAQSINDSGQIVGRGYRTSTPTVTRYFLLNRANVAPTLSLPAQIGVDEGGSVVLTATSADENPQSLTYAWSVVGVGAIADEDGATATYATGTADGGPGASAIVRVTVTDDEGLTATAETVVTIANVPPSATFSASPGTVYPGDPVTLALSGATDPSAADTAAGFTFAFACSASEALGALTPASSRSCTYAAAGPQVVRGRVADKDGGSSDYSVTVTVQSPQDGIAGLMQLVQALQASGALDARYAAVLIGNLEAAIRHLDRGQVGLAVFQLAQFSVRVVALVAVGVLDAATGRPLVDGAIRVIDALI